MNNGYFGGFSNNGHFGFIGNKRSGYELMPYFILKNGHIGNHSALESFEAKMPVKLFNPYRL